MSYTYLLEQGEESSAEHLMAGGRFPTPTKSDGKGASARRFFGSESYKGNLREFLRDGIADGQYPNPSLSEWMMGWPIGWTELQQLETAKFQQWLEDWASKNSAGQSGVNSLLSKCSEHLLTRVMVNSFIRFEGLPLNFLARVSSNRTSFVLLPNRMDGSGITAALHVSTKQPVSRLGAWVREVRARDSVTKPVTDSLTESGKGNLKPRCLKRYTVYRVA